MSVHHSNWHKKKSAYLRELLFFMIAFILISPRVASSDPLQLSIATTGVPSTQQLGAKDTNTKLVRFTFISSGNSSEGYDLYLEAPKGAKVSARAKNIGKSGILASAFSDAKSWNALPLVSQTNKSYGSFLFNRKSLSVNTRASLDCTGLNNDAIQGIIAIYQFTYGVTVTPTQLCGAGNVPSGTTSNPTQEGSPIGTDNLGTQFAMILSKDACTSGGNSQYLISLEFDLSGVDPAVYGRGLSVTASAFKRNFSGSRASALKPVSAGKYAPNPLLLMSSLSGASAGEKIRLVKWSRSKIRSTKSLKMVKYTYYKGLVLADALLTNLLTGGKGTFEISNGHDAYSVCFSLSRSRQNINGYPG